MFKLSDSFLAKYEGRDPKWGYGALSSFTFKRTYSRLMENNKQETFVDCLKRVTEGCFRIQEEFCKRQGLEWNPYRAQKTAQEFFQRMFEFKFLPPGRGMWIMGTPIVNKIGSAALNNCGFTSTKNLANDLASSFIWAMDSLMLGVGVGFDCCGAGKVTIKQPSKNKMTYRIPDSREGWVESVKLLINSYQIGNYYVEFIYDDIRPAGTLIKGFGGTSSGPQPLIDLHNSIRKLLDELVGQPITSVAIVDLFNFIGKCVVSGNVRRSAEIAIGNLDDEAYITMKDYDKHSEELLDRRWASNNSVFVTSDSDFSKVTGNIIKNGEPGLIFLENARHYGRMKDGWLSEDSERYDDVDGFNPCLTGDTRVATQFGLLTIKELAEMKKQLVVTTDNRVQEDYKVDASNLGISTRVASPAFQTSELEEVYEITTADGHTIKATAYHKFPTPRGFVQVKDLTIKDSLLLQSKEGVWGTNGTAEIGHIIGWIEGDGNFSVDKNDRNKDSACLRFWGKQKYLANIFLPWCQNLSSQSSSVNGRIYSFNLINIPKRDSVEFSSVILARELSKHGYNHKGHVPEVIWTGTRDCVRGYLRGLFAADGYLNWSKNKNCFSIRLSQINIDLLKEVQILLNNFGIASKIYHRKEKCFKKLPDGLGGYKEYLCQPIYDLVISKTNALTFGEKIGFLLKTNELKFNKWKETVSRGPYKESFTTKIVSITQVESAPVFCLTQPTHHTFIANGIPTGNCSEQPLEDKELCCLVETFPTNHESAEDYYQTLKHAYLYAKTVTLIPTHDEQTNAVIMRNRRIGCSMSGIQQAIQKFGHHKFISEFCDKGYEVIKKYDRVYSRWLGIPRSIRMSTVKPSGCCRKDTLISTDKGLLTLAEIGEISSTELPNTWKSHEINVATDYIPQKSTQFYINGKVSTKKIITSDGIEIEASLNHKLRIVDSENNYLWRTVSNLQIGDKLACKLDTNIVKTVPKLQKIEDKTIQEIKMRQPDVLTKDLAWFLGLFYGDGSVHKKGIRISFNRKQPAIIKWITSFIKKEFDLPVVIGEDDAVYINSQQLLRWLNKNNILKSFCEDITLPKIIRQSPKELALAFIDGFWRADGGIHNETNWGVCSVSKEFAQQFLILCRSIGINSKIKCAGPGGLGSKDRWIITNRGPGPNRYQSLELKQRYFNDLWLDPIVSIEDSEADTYDIEVPDGNTYIANGIVSHNTVSILAGALPGVHYAHSEFYFRTVRCAASSPLLLPLIKANYRIEYSVTDKDRLNQALKEAGYDADSIKKNYEEVLLGKKWDQGVFEKFGALGGTMVIYFPIKEKNFHKSKFDTTIWEQLSIVREMQYSYSDNAVSCTITFSENEQKDLESAIKFFAPYVKTLSFLPLVNHKYAQAPYQECTEEEYNTYVKSLKEVKFKSSTEGNISGSKFCDGDSCEV